MVRWGQVCESISETVMKLYETYLYKNPLTISINN